jgi:hypothetical protein
VIGAATWVAWRGIRDWREERIDARQSEAAEQALVVAYKAEEVFKGIRITGGFSGEGSSRKPEPNEPPEEKKRLDSAFVPIERINKAAWFFDQVVEIKPRVAALFGKARAEPFNEFLAVQWEIIGEAHKLSQLRQGGHFRTPEEQQEHFDNTTERLQRAVASIESFAGPVLESRLRPRKSA